jgi:hypothetical protein
VLTVQRDRSSITLSGSPSGQKYLEPTHPVPQMMHCCYDKMQVNKLSLIDLALRLLLIDLLHMHQGECASYRSAIDESDWPIQTVMGQVFTGHT